ncbi:MAG: hypothetical protein EOO26_11620 [Comamonadaceae bacterium]|nr:MAG: hypothetical protein EOO26_11620 [Comamonadaceae bacterium]
MSIPLFERVFANRFFHRALHKALFGGAMVFCLAWSVASALRTPATPERNAAFHEWPSEWDGAPLRPLALGDVEQRFAQQFPGAIARMTDGQQMLVLRQVTTPTRMLHPAADCYRALGYRIEKARLERDAQARLWRCFEAQRGVRSTPGQTTPLHLRVCERIVDADGAAFTDTSAWYWAASSGRSQGPWEAVTVARPM